ncbi:ribosome-associated toxin RatA of RatAB toxin-antitoxin module [Nocardia transvalensis]|uniref:Ribosome-associated toxin RatA of RatAB toxin-antitoxin module n=1 Tax=Nocardia transvalensis TaxID=37333 RepID=A0A7W9UN07_9NOCA|nr:aromatase/cyclase [Nocardia transvalensis]MBB5918330.1 ribosome-associated toxin RatA of RatAB toxin-antitoxin module [Nocardia transvalensis]
MQIRRTEHVVTAPASADTVYDLIANAELWPAIFTPTVHVEIISADDEPEQRLKIWAFAGGQVRSWVSHRTLNERERRVGFRQTEPAAPVASMRGEWAISPIDETSSKVVFQHWFSAEGDSADILGKIEDVVNENSLAELESLRLAAERSHLVVGFEDTVRIDAGPDRIYEFLAEAGKWPALIPHVGRVELTEDAGVQTMDMDTVDSAGDSADNDVHTTSSVRVLLPPNRIVYKQTTLPPFLTAHVGSWDVRADGTAVARHTVVLREESILPMLGPEATVEQAAGLVRQSIGGNSRATLQRARAVIGAGR